MSIKTRVVKIGRSIKEHPFVFLRRVLYVLVGTFLAYLLIVNIALQTRLIRGYLEKPPAEVTLEYKRAYSIFPGRFHVEGLVLRGQDSVIEWRLQVDKADYWMSFPDLARKVYHVKSVRADGLEFRVRLRMDPQKPVDPDHVAALPPVEGFVAPPMKNPATETPTDISKIWSVTLDDVDALHVREVWIDTIRSTGDMHIRGRWKFVPTQYIDLGPAFIDALGVTLAYGNIPIATDVHGSINVTLSGTDIPTATDRDFMQHLGATVDVEGMANTFTALQTFALPKGTTGSGSSPLMLALRFDHGKLADGTHLELQSAPLEIKHATASLKSVPHVVFDVRKNAEGIDTGTGSIEATAIKFGYGDTNAKAASATVSGMSQKLDLGAFPLSQVSVDVSVKEAFMTHQDLDVRVGSATVKSSNLALDYDAMTTAGIIDLAATGIYVPLGKETLSGSISAKIRTRPDKDSTVFSGTSIAFDGAMAPRAEPWWTRIEVSSGTVKASLPHSLRMQTQLRAKNATPAAALLASVTGVPRWVLDAAPLDDLRGSAGVYVKPDTVELRSVSVKGGAQAFRFEYAERGKNTEWLLMADAGPLRLGIHSSRIGTDIRLLDVESWYQKIAGNMRATSPVR